MGPAWGPEVPTLGSQERGPWECPCVFSNSAGDTCPEGLDPTDQGTSASLLESACHPEPPKGAEGS